MILPYVLEYYGESAHQPLAELADLVKISEPSDTMEKKAHRFIQAIKDLNESMEIPKNQWIQEEDIAAMVEQAYKEANPLYPVPRIFTKEDLTNIYELIREKN